MKSHKVMESRKNMKSPKETVLSEKKVVLELWRSGANKRGREVRERRGKLGKYCV